MPDQTLITLFILSPMIVVGGSAIAVSICNALPSNWKLKKMKDHNQCCRNCKHCIPVGKLKIDCCDLSQEKEWDEVEGFIIGDYQTCGECVGSKICKWELYRTV